MSIAGVAVEPSPTRRGNLLRRAIRGIHALTDLAALCAFASIALSVLVVVHMIVIRLAGASVVWHMELAIHLTIVAVFLGSPYAARTNGHVGVDLLENAVPPGLRRLVRSVLQLVVVAVCAYLAIVGARYTWDAYVGGVTSTSLWAPRLWPVYATMPLGLALTGLQVLAQFGESMLAVGAGRGDK